MVNALFPKTWVPLNVQWAVFENPARACRARHKLTPEAHTNRLYWGGGDNDLQHVIGRGLGDWRAGCGERMASIFL
eukprot:10639018-Alexandrium_andersonii.AAC.1